MLILIISYIIGAIPTGYLLTHYTRPLARLLAERSEPHIHRHLNRHIPSLVSIAADAAKGMLVVALAPILAALAVRFRVGFTVFPLISPGFILAGALCAAALGHVFSVYICGWGGRGGAVILGGFLIIAPVPTVWALVVFAVSAAISRAVWPSTLFALAALPIILLWFDAMNRVPIIAAALLFALSLMTHHHDISHTGATDE